MAGAKIPLKIHCAANHFLKLFWGARQAHSNHGVHAQTMVSRELKEASTHSLQDLAPASRQPG